MSRWEPNAGGRLVKAAMELYHERGFEATTVAEIAKRAGLTERTFFRYFSDKREVLFSGTEVLRDVLAGKVEEAPAPASPFEAVGGALVEVSEAFDDRSFARQRRAIIVANPELQERELSKLATWASAMAAALRRRGVGDPAAALAAEAGMAVFKVAFDRWVEDDDGGRTLADLIREGALEMTVVTGAVPQGIAAPGRTGQPLSA
jgi:AcrR family transcriptional regulator